MVIDLMDDKNRNLVKAGMLLCRWDEFLNIEGRIAFINLAFENTRYETGEDALFEAKSMINLNGVPNKKALQLIQHYANMRPLENGEEPLLRYIKTFGELLCENRPQEKGLKDELYKLVGDYL